MRAVVLSSTHERAFCVGADLKERNSFTDADLMRQRPHTRAAYTGVLELPMPTIAAVHGFALGGGFELALACDLIVADGTAVVGLPEVSVGVIPGGGGTQLLPRRVGAARAAELVFTARRVPAAEAGELGLVDQFVADGQDRAEALALAARIARNSPVGLRAAKRAHAARARAGSACGAGPGGRRLAQCGLLRGPGGGRRGVQREAGPGLAGGVGRAGWPLRWSAAGCPRGVPGRCRTGRAGAPRRVR